jgi:hypothetical protein
MTDMYGPKSVTLSSPIEVKGQPVSVLTFREATAGDLATADAVPGNMNQTLAILAAISEIPLPAFRKIKARDLKRIIAEVGDLLGNDPQELTGD